MEKEIAYLVKNKSNSIQFIAYNMRRLEHYKHLYEVLAKIRVTKKHKI